ATRVLATGGVLGMVVPNRLYRNKNAGGIRRILSQRTTLLTIIDFGPNEVFENTSAYVGCIVAERIVSDAVQRDRVRVIDVRQLPARFLATVLLDAEESSTDMETTTLRVYFAQHPRGEAAWLLLSQNEQLSQVRLGEASEPLQNIAGIFQGIRTGANDI